MSTATLKVLPVMMRKSVLYLGGPRLSWHRDQLWEVSCFHRPSR